MGPVSFFHKGEFRLGGFHVGSDISARWEKYEREEKAAKLPNAVDYTGFEVRVFLPEGIDIFTGVEVTGRNILPGYELLAVPPNYYALFEIDCNADIDSQFIGMDAWLSDNKDRYKRVKWKDSNADYIIIWSGRYGEEMICEVWVPLESLE